MSGMGNDNDKRQRRRLVDKLTTTTTAQQQRDDAAAAEDTTATSNARTPPKFKTISIDLPWPHFTIYAQQQDEDSWNNTDLWLSHDVPFVIGARRFGRRRTRNQPWKIPTTSSSTRRRISSSTSSCTEGANDESFSTCG
jgi:glycosidase